MAIYERDGVTLVTAVEELAAGRYRGLLRIDTEAGQWCYTCLKCRGTPSEASADANADREYAYRRYLTELRNRKDSDILE